MTPKVIATLCQKHKLTKAKVAAAAAAAVGDSSCC